MLVVPSALVVTTAVVFPPFTKFTLSYGLTKSRASLLFCKFHPAFNTSPTVAALFGLMYLLPALSVVFGKAALVVCAFVPALAPSKLLAIFDNVVGFLVPSGPFTDVITSSFDISFPVPSEFG